MVEVVRDKKPKWVLTGVIVFVSMALLAVIIAVVAISVSRGQFGDNYKEEEIVDPSQDSDISTGSSSTEADDDDKSNGEIKGTIDYRSLVGETLQIRTTINGVLNNGICALTIVGPNKQEYKSTVKAIKNTDATSTCNGFDVDMARLEKEEELRAGKWTITINLTDGDRTGQMTSEMTL